jgi:hypothetical protein
MAKTKEEAKMAKDVRNGRVRTEMETSSIIQHSPMG